METVYSLDGWVKEVIDNENAEILQRFNDYGDRRDGEADVGRNAQIAHRALEAVFPTA